MVVSSSCDFVPERTTYDCRPRFSDARSAHLLRLVRCAGHSADACRRVRDPCPSRLGRRGHVDCWLVLYHCGHLTLPVCLEDAYHVRCLLGDIARLSLSLLRPVSDLPPAGRAGLTDVVSCCLFLLQGDRRDRSLLPASTPAWVVLAALRRDHQPRACGDDLEVMAVQFGVGHRDSGRDQPALHRHLPPDADAYGATGCWPPDHW